MQIAKFNSPYITSFKKDAPIIAAGADLTALGVYLVQNKKDITNDELRLKQKIRFLFSIAEMPAFIQTNQ
ncbi:MAG: hypothetical protein ABJA71_04260 [Ginsengibacter sp.]